MATTIYQLKTFKDIVDAVMEELKYQSSDTVNKNRIKRDINMIYLDEVLPYEQWKWLRGNVTLTQQSLTSVTAAVTQNSKTVTLSGAPAASISYKGYLLNMTGKAEIYKIASHAAGSTAVTLDVAYIGPTGAAQTCTIWTDKLALPVDLRDTVQVTTNKSTVPLSSAGVQQFRRQAAVQPLYESFPRIYCTSDYVEPVPFAAISGLPAASSFNSVGLRKGLTFASDVSTYLQVGDVIQVTASTVDTFDGIWTISSVDTANVYFTGLVPYEAGTTAGTFTVQKLSNEQSSSRCKELWIHPSRNTSQAVLNVDYTKETAPLVEDTDEPLMPIGDRTVLLYGALSRAWSRERNPEESAGNIQKFGSKLGKMAGKMDDSTDLPILRVGKTYLAGKRNIRGKGRRVGRFY